jgi:hypothetical protein
MSQLLSQFKPLTYILQVFSPANVIFTGIGVFLSVSILDHFSADHSHIDDLIGGTGSCSEQRCSRGALRPHRMVFRATRNLYRGSSDYRNDKYNHGDNCGSTQDLWDRDKGAKAGISK